MKERPIICSGESVRAILDDRKTQTRRVVGTMDSFGSAPKEFWQHADLARAFVDGKGSGCEYLHVPAHVAPDCERCAEMDWQGTTHRCYARISPVGAWDETPDSDYTPPAIRLWVRETWAETDSDGGPVIAYKAGGYLMHGATGSRRAGTWKDETFPGDAGKIYGGERWRNPMFMPRWASRLTLEVTAVRVERLQELSEADALAEGVEREDLPSDPDNFHPPGSYGFIVSGGRGKATIHVKPQEAFAERWDSINGKRAPWASNPWVWVVSFRRAGA